jgi:hypothetical protein
MTNADTPSAGPPIPPIPEVDGSPEKEPSLLLVLVQDVLAKAAATVSAGILILQISLKQRNKR